LKAILLFLEKNANEKVLKNQAKTTLGTWHFVAIKQLRLSRLAALSG
jgi:hypothetical protein